jgi:CRP-like cAMP-binding protein
MLEITKNAKRVTYRPGEVILATGQPVDSLFVVKSGSVDVTKVNAQGETRLSELDECEFFGEIECMRGGNALATVRAAPMEAVDVLVYPREDFLRILKESPITAEALGKIVEEKLKSHV